jgi:hypothetical protein
MPRQDERIHACSLFVFNPFRVGNHINSFVFFVDVRMFLQPAAYGFEPGVEVAWDRWGPQNTRWFSERMSADWQHALHGYRTVDTVPPIGGRGDSPWLRRLRIRDYNPHAIARHLREKEAGGWDGRAVCRVVTSPSVVPAQGAFEHDVVSTLPYREIISAETFVVTDVMMDDSRILLLKVSSCGPSGRGVLWR